MGPGDPLALMQRRYLLAMLLRGRPGSPATVREVAAEFGHNINTLYQSVLPRLRAKGCLATEGTTGSARRYRPLGSLLARPDGGRCGGVSLTALSPSETDALLSRLLANAPGGMP